MRVVWNIWNILNSQFDRATPHQSIEYPGFLGTIKTRLDSTTEHSTMKNLTILVSSSLAKAVMLGIAATTTGIAVGAAPAHAVSFTGTLSNADDIRSVFFTVTSPSTVSFKSSGYLAGGFDPILTLFSPTGQYGTPSGLADFDFSRSFSTGTYRAVISAFPNFFEYYNYSNPKFSDWVPGGGDLNGRSSYYAFDIVTTPTATAVPEPSSLIGTALAGFAVVRLKRKLASGKKLN
jgi:hypothetical protein